MLGNAGIRSMLERTIISLAVWSGAIFLLVTASSDHFVTIVGLVGPLVGAVTTYWFRASNDATPPASTTITVPQKNANGP